MDKNQTIGFALIFALMMVYFYLTPEPEQTQTNTTETTQTEVVTDPVSGEEQTPNLSQEDVTPVAPLDSAELEGRWGIFSTGVEGTAQEVVLENEDVKITFSTKGGQVKSVVLKNHKEPNGDLVTLLTPETYKLRWLLPTTLPQGKINLNQLYFKADKKSDDVLTFRLDLADGRNITKKYRLDPKGYILDYDLDVSSLQSVLAAQHLEVSWQDNLRLLEPSMEISRRYATVNYYTDEFDQLTEMSNSLQEETLELPVKWIAMKQRFFNAALLTDAQFEKVSVKSNVNEADTTTVKMLKADFQVPLASLSEAGNLRYYFGPNEYYTLREVAPGFEENIYFGWAIFRPVSRYIILPLFTFLDGFFTNYGILIIVMVVFIKLVLSPLTYRSYFSQAKTKFIQPELAQIDEKYGDDKQTAQQEKLKLMTQVGANPMLGCIPMLLQMPILFALFMFFPVLIDLRGESFLWATDLSNFDSILELPFSIPFYGAHVSAFTLLMAGTQFGTVMVNGQTPATPQNSPINMKFIMYFMPIMLLFFFNTYPAGLTLYYFVSNAITVLLTLGIRKFFINEDKIAAIIERNRKKNAGKKKSAFMAKLEEAQKAQQEAADKRKRLKNQQQKGAQNRNVTRKKRKK